MSDFEQFTDEQLKAELERREKEAKQKAKPQQLEELNLARLRKICQDYIDEVERDAWASEDTRHYIYEIALETVFGEDVFNWVNGCLR